MIVECINSQFANKKKCFLSTGKTSYFEWKKYQKKLILLHKCARNQKSRVVSSEDTVVKAVLLHTYNV